MTNKYKYKNCGYDGEALIFECNDYAYCIAFNDIVEPEYVGISPRWVEDLGLGDAEIGNPGAGSCYGRKGHVVIGASQALLGV